MKKIIEAEVREDILWGVKQYLEGGITHQEFKEEIKDYLKEGKTSMGSIIPKSLKIKYCNTDIVEETNRYGEPTGKYCIVYG